MYVYYINGREFLFCHTLLAHLYASASVWSVRVCIRTYVLAQVRSYVCAYALAFVYIYINVNERLLFLLPSMCLLGVRPAVRL